MKVFRRILAALLLPILLAVTTAIGTVAAIVFTPPGHALLARIATRWITDAAAGAVEIGEIRGNIWNSIELNHVTVHDSLGVLVLSAAHIEAGYAFRDLFRRRQVFQHVFIDSLVLHLVRLRPTKQFPEGHWNYEKVFHLGEGPDNGLPPPYMGFYGLRLTNAFVQVDAPTTPGSPHRSVSRNGRAPGTYDHAAQGHRTDGRRYAAIQAGQHLAAVVHVHRRGPGALASRLAAVRPDA